MTDKQSDAANVAVIIARFQVPYLSDAHKALIQTALDRHKRLIIVLGLAPIQATERNPLDYEARRQMIQDEFKDDLDRLTILYHKDQPVDATWVRQLDNLIADHTTHDTVMLYGGRDSFIPVYQKNKGKYPVQELAGDEIVSGTLLRKQAAQRAKNSAEFRAGVVYATARRYPTVYTAVDIAVFNDMSLAGKEDFKLLLAAKEQDGGLWRFPGGFSDPESRSFEVDAQREIREETAIEIDKLTYLGSQLIDDWRYRNEKDKIKTLLFMAEYHSGTPEAGDDIHHVKWWKFDDVTEDLLVPNHRPLLAVLRTALGACVQKGCDPLENMRKAFAAVAETQKPVRDPLLPRHPLLPTDPPRLPYVQPVTPRPIHYPHPPYPHSPDIWLKTTDDIKIQPAGE